MNEAEMLARCSPIVGTIFKHLSARDLGNCAQVCKMWKSISETECKRRLFMEWFLQLGREDHYLGMFGHGPDEKFDFQKSLLNAWSKPATCFCLMTMHTMDSQWFAMEMNLQQPSFKKTKMGKFEKRRHLLRAISDHFLKPCLPSQCQLFCMSSSGIIGSHGNHAPVEVEFGAAVTGLLIPHFPGVEIHHVTIERNTAPELPKVPIKCLLMFMGSFPELIQPFVDRCVANQKEKFALGGAMIAAPETGLGACFAFTGENVEAASILIDYSVRDVEAELKSFERTGLLKNQCFCFAFTCIEKGSRFYTTSNYESDLFHKIYPNVPLMGVFGYGEIGAYHAPNVDEKLQEKRSKRFDISGCVHSHSTTFVLLSIRKTN